MEAYKKSVAQEAISDGHNAENALDMKALIQEQFQQPTARELMSH